MRVKSGGSRAKQPLQTRRPGPKNMAREVRGEREVQQTEGAGAAHRECGSGC